MVISGGNFKPDTLKPKEVVSLLLDDDEIGTKCEYEMIYQFLGSFGCLVNGTNSLFIISFFNYIFSPAKDNRWWGH